MPRHTDEVHTHDVIQQPRASISTPRAHATDKQQRRRTPALTASEREWRVNGNVWNTGAGPTTVAVTKDKATGIAAAEAMVAAFEQQGKLEVNMAAVVKLSTAGAHVCAADASTNAASAHFVRL